MINKKIKRFNEHIIEKNNYVISEDFIDKDAERLARIKVNKAVIWINVNRGFFGRLLANLSIYGSSSLNPKTMATNGLNIVYHPEFVMAQSKGAIHFVLCHEILHCVGDHMTRRGTRDPEIWNYAADYAINPILHEEIGRDFEWPKNPDGTRMGLYEEKYAGMRAEDIYDDLIKNGTKPPPGGWDLGDVSDSTEDMPAPDSSASIVQDVSGDGEDGEGNGSTIPKPGKEEKGDGEGDGEGAGEKGEGDGEDGGSGSSIIGKTVTVTAGPHEGKRGIVKSVLPNGDIVI